MDWSEELDAAEQAARQAGAVLLDWSGCFSVAHKGPADLVTEADRAAEETIVGVLQRRFPSDAILAEEGTVAAAAVGPSGKSNGRRWIIDPLDGTTNFVHGLPFFAVSIGLEANGDLVAGVVYDPVRKELFRGAVRHGARRNGVPITVSGAASLRDALVTVGVPGDPDEQEVATASTARVSKRSRGVRRLGSAAMALAYVAAGRMDGYWAPRLRPWDLAAGIPLVLAAGGQATNLDGGAFRIETPDVVASNGLLHAELVAAIA